MKTRLIINNCVACSMLLSPALVAAPTPTDVAAPVSDEAVRAFTEQSQCNQAIAVAWAQQHGLPVRHLALDPGGRHDRRVRHRCQCAQHGARLPHSPL